MCKLGLYFISLIGKLFYFVKIKTWGSAMWKIEYQYWTKYANKPGHGIFQNLDYKYITDLKER